MQRNKNRPHPANPVGQSAQTAHSPFNKRPLPRKVPPHIPFDDDDDRDRDTGPLVTVANDTKAVAPPIAKKASVAQRSCDPHTANKNVTTAAVVKVDHEKKEEDPDENDEEEQARAVVPLTDIEIERRANRDIRIWRRLGTVAQNQLKTIPNSSGLATQLGHMIVSYGAALRICVVRTLEAHEKLRFAESVDTPQQHRARLKESETNVENARQRVENYVEWVAANRPWLADDEDILESLDGTKAQRTEAKSRLVTMDQRFDVLTPAKSQSKSKGAKDATAFMLPRMYRNEYKGKVRAYPGWVAPVLRKVAKKGSRNIPAMAFVISQMVYWLEPKNGTGEPRARRSIWIAGKWWIVLGYGEIEKQTPVSRGQARMAMKRLKALNLVEAIKPAEAGVTSIAGNVNYGPNTVFLRLKTKVLEPLILAVSSG